YSDTCCRSFIYFFFFQAEDGIRDRNVTGVQTCALPIYPPRSDERSPVPYCAVETFRPTEVGHVLEGLAAAVDIVSQADRERRVSGPKRPRAKIHAHMAQGHREFVREEIDPWCAFILRNIQGIARRRRE